MAADGKDMRLIRRYRRLVEDYEAIDSRIDELIMSKQGKSEDMSVKDRRLYREMARRRSEIQNEMRLLERQLNLMEDDTPGAE
ncbi:MAG: hypothetical protein OXG78_04300 [Chloroflexi bacterium]|nr:hypothetical protein [Chloroflexota bacterium]